MPLWISVDLRAPWMCLRVSLALLRAPLHGPVQLTWHLRSFLRCVRVCLRGCVCMCVCVRVFVYVHPTTQELGSHPKCSYCQSSQGIPHFINDNGQWSSPLQIKGTSPGCPPSQRLLFFLFPAAQLPRQQAPLASSNPPPAHESLPVLTHSFTPSNGANAGWPPRRQNSGWP